MNRAVQTSQSIFFSRKLFKTCYCLVFVFLFSVVLEWRLLLYPPPPPPPPFFTKKHNNLA